MDKLKNIRSPFERKSPYERIERARRKRLIVAISKTSLIFSIPLVIMLTILLAINLSVQGVIELILAGMVAIVSIIAHQLSIRDKVVAASFILLVPVMFIISINGVLISGFSPIVVVGFFICTIVMGMIIGPVPGYVIAGLSTIFYVLVQALVWGEIVPASTVPGAFVPIFVFIINTMAFFFVAIISQISTQDLRNALDQATYDLVRANHQLEQASEMKSQFTARTSHELRTPLSSIITFTELALREAYGPIQPKLTEKLEHVLNSAQHLRDIINDLLDLAKIEAGELEITEESFAVQTLAETVQSTLEAPASQKGIALHVKISQEMPAKVIGDEGRLIQILLNLAGNAVKFTDEGEVEVNIELADEAHWRMRVRDTGPGIPEDRFETVFEEYRQLETQPRDAEKMGTGLGLAITRNLVQMMGGDVHLESELGVGTIFEVVLPLKTPEPLAMA